MVASLDVFTRRLEACRRQWNRGSLDYVLESAKILQEAKTAADNERRWLRWVTEAAHMSRMTATRHLGVAHFLSRNVTLKRHCATISISKVYALSRTKPIVAHRMLSDERVRRMTDVEFAGLIRPYLPKTKRRPTVPNLLRSILSGLEKASRGIARWKGARTAIPPEHRSRIQLRLREMDATVGHLRALRRRAL